MSGLETRNSTPRWRAVGSAALALAAVAVIGFTTISPAKSDYYDWRYRRHTWRHDYSRPCGLGSPSSYPPYSYGSGYYPSPSYGYYGSYPSYSYYSYPSYRYYSYPSYGYYYGSSDYGYDYTR